MTIRHQASIAFDRRTFLGSASLAAVGCALAGLGNADAEPIPAVSLFNGKTLAGWTEIQNSETAFSGSGITDLAALAKAISERTSSIAASVNDALDTSLRAEIDSFANSNASDDKGLRSALAKNLTTLIGGQTLYDKSRFHGVHLRSETRRLLQQHPNGRRLVELNRMLLVDAFPAELSAVSPGWTVKDGAMASTGAGRGVIYTVRDLSRFRLKFKIRHISGNPDHQACVLIFCTRPSDDTIPLDALGGIQFQVPKGGHWDYRPGRNTAGGEEFTLLSKVSFDPHEWSSVEIVADGSTGTARMAVAQPAGSRAIEVLSFHDPSAGKSGPIAWQMHNAGLFDEYKDITIEVDPTSLELTSTE